MKGFINFQYHILHTNNMKAYMQPKRSNPTSQRYQQNLFETKRNSFPLKHSVKQIITSKKIKLKVQSINKNITGSDNQINEYESKFKQIQKLFNLKVSGKKDEKKKISYRVISPESIPEFQITKFGFSRSPKMNKSTDLKRSTDKQFKIWRKMHKNRSFDKVLPCCSSIRPVKSSCLTEAMIEDENTVKKRSSFLKQNTKNLNPRILIKKKKQKEFMQRSFYEKEKLKGWEIEEENSIF